MWSRGAFLAGRRRAAAASRVIPALAVAIAVALAGTFAAALGEPGPAQARPAGASLVLPRAAEGFAPAIPPFSEKAERPAPAGSLAVAFGAEGDDANALTPPPVVDPKSVATQPITPGADRPFAREDVLAPEPVLTLSGTAKWDDAYDTLVAAIRTLEGELAQLGLKRAGDVFVVYTTSDDAGFSYEVQMPFSGVTTKTPDGKMKLGASYAGKVLRFTHEGAFTDMDNTYEMIANYLDEKNIDANEVYMEQYLTDLATTAPDKLKIDILVPVP